MRKILILTFFLFCMGNMAQTWAYSPDMSGQTGKVTLVVSLDPVFRQNEKAYNIIKGALIEKFGSAEIIYCDDASQTKPAAYHEFIEKVQTDPINNDSNKGVTWIREEHLHKFGQDNNSKFILLINLRVTGYNQNGYYWPKMTFCAYDVEAAKPIAVNTWVKGRTGYGTEGAEFFMTKLRNDFKWPTSVIPEPQLGDTAKRAVVVFVPDDIMEMPELVQKIRSTIASKLNITEVPIYIDSNPKTQAFLSLVNKVAVDSAKQEAPVVRKEYLSAYGKQIGANTVISIKIGYTEAEFDIWAYKMVYRLNAEILAVDTETNKYISSMVYDIGSKKGRQEGVELLMNKLKTEYTAP